MSTAFLPRHTERKTLPLPREMMSAEQFLPLLSPEFAMRAMQQFKMGRPSSSSHMVNQQPMASFKSSMTPPAVSAAAGTAAPTPAKPPPTFFRTIPPLRNAKMNCFPSWSADRVFGKDVIVNVGGVRYVSLVANNTAPVFDPCSQTLNSAAWARRPELPNDAPTLQELALAERFVEVIVRDTFRHQRFYFQIPFARINLHDWTYLQQATKATMPADQVWNVGSESSTDGSVILASAAAQKAENCIAGKNTVLFQLFGWHPQTQWQVRHANLSTLPSAVIERGCSAKWSDCRRNWSESGPVTTCTAARKCAVRLARKWTGDVQKRQDKMPAWRAFMKEDDILAAREQEAHNSKWYSRIVIRIDEFCPALHDARLTSEPVPDDCLTTNKICIAKISGTKRRRLDTTSVPAVSALSLPPPSEEKEEEGDDFVDHSASGSMLGHALDEIERLRRLNWMLIINTGAGRDTLLRPFDKFASKAVLSDDEDFFESRRAVLSRRRRRMRTTSGLAVAKFPAPPSSSEDDGASDANFSTSESSDGQEQEDD